MEMNYLISVAGSKVNTQRGRDLSKYKIFNHIKNMIDELKNLLSELPNFLNENIYLDNMYTYL